MKVYYDKDADLSLIKGKNVTWAEPSERGIGMVDGESVRREFDARDCGGAGLRGCGDRSGHGGVGCSILDTVTPAGAGWWCHCSSGRGRWGAHACHGAIGRHLNLHFYFILLGCIVTCPRKRVQRHNMQNCHPHNEGGRELINPLTILNHWRT